MVLGYRKVLQYMKTQNLKLNEAIFNALVKGHVRKGFVTVHVFTPLRLAVHESCVS